MPMPRPLTGPYIFQPSGAPFSGRKQYAGFLDPGFICLRLFGRVYPSNKVPAFDRREILPLKLSLRVSPKGFIKIHWHYCKTARAPFSGCKHTAGFLDPSFTCLGLLGCVYPNNKVPARERREALPHCLYQGRSGKGFFKIARHSGLQLFSSPDGTVGGRRPRIFVHV